jgi:type II secretory pathway pseudopilin PulG
MTLIELVAVIVIMALVVGIAAVRMDFMVPRYRLRGAAREVAYFVKRARSQAASTGKDVYIRYDLGRGAYWLLVAFPKKDPNAPDDEKPREFEYKETLRSALPDGVQFATVILGPKEIRSEGVVDVRVSPFGSMHHHIVNLRNKNGQEFALRVNGFTGAVQFFDRHQEPEELLEDQGP